MDWRWAGKVLAITSAALVFLVPPAEAAGARVKDLVMIGGARENQLVGYGLVAGINSEGDKNLVFTVQSIANMLQRFGISVPSTTLQSKNVAAVIVTAEIPPFLKPGARLDVHVSSMGDAKTLQGGILLQTPLFGADNSVYAVAQGPLLVGGYSAGPGGAGGASVQKNATTTAQIIGGAIVEKEIPSTIVRDNHIELILREPDFTSAVRLSAAINDKFTNSAQAVDATTVRVRIPQAWENTAIDFIAQLEVIEVTPDTSARIIINERTGTIVANSRIRISSCAISHGNLTINISSTLNVSQPPPLSQTGQTTVVPRTETTTAEKQAAMIPLPELPTVERVAAALNTLGVTPRDMMSIFQAMKQAGALQAELIIR
jgi:flagellar P-ring protein FlgI